MRVLVLPRTSGTGTVVEGPRCKKNPTVTDPSANFADRERLACDHLAMSDFGNQLMDFARQDLQQALANIMAGGDNHRKRVITGKAAGKQKKPKPKKESGKQRATKAQGRADATKTKIKQKRKKSVSKKKTESLKKKVKKIEAKLKDDPKSLFVYKQDIGGQILLAPGKAAYKLIEFWEPTSIEACVDAVPYVPIAAPNTTTTVNLTTVTANQKIPMDLYSKIFFKNNHSMPLNFVAYILEFKENMTSVTAGSPQVYVEMAADLAKGGLANVSAGDALVNNPAFYPSDSVRWKKDMKVIETFNVRLDAGDEYEISSANKIKYNQEAADNEGGVTKQLRKYTRVCLVRLTGVVAHDKTTTTNVGWGDGGIDFILCRVFKVTDISENLKTNMYEVSNATALGVPVIAGMDVVIEEEKAA